MLRWILGNGSRDFSRQNPFHLFGRVLQPNLGGIPWIRLPAILPGLLSINILKQGKGWINGSMMKIGESVELPFYIN